MHRCAGIVDVVPKLSKDIMSALREMLMHDEVLGTAITCMYCFDTMAEAYVSRITTTINIDVCVCSRRALGIGQCRALIALCAPQAHVRHV